MEFIRNHIQKLLIVLSVILLSTIIYKVTHLIENGNIVKVQKSDYAELHSVQYGLFNSVVWTDKISLIVEQKIDEFNFTKSSRLEIKTYVETILDALIVEAEKVVRKKNKKRGHSIIHNIANDQSKPLIWQHGDEVDIVKVKLDKILQPGASFTLIIESTVLLPDDKFT